MAGPISAVCAVALATSMLLTQVNHTDAAPKKDYTPLFSRHLFTASLAQGAAAEPDWGIIGKIKDPEPEILEIAPKTRVTIVLSAPRPVQGAGVRDRLMRVASCESSQIGYPPNWSINTGNGYYGGLQFDLATWQSVGGVGYPHLASMDEQLYRAELLVALNKGYSAWPHCGFM